MTKKYFIQLSFIFAVFMGIGGLFSTQSEASEFKSEVNTRYIFINDLSIDQQYQCIIQMKNK